MSFCLLVNHFFLGLTLAQMEKMRTEYRGALMWMKNISQDFNPDQYSQLEKFRQVQEIVRLKKAKFDSLKIKSIQKIDLLAASRCNMFSHALILYQNAIITFSEKTAKTLNTVASNFQGYQHYNFTVIKELAEPLERQCIADGTSGSDDQKDSKGKKGKPKLAASGAADRTIDKEKSDSLVNLFNDVSDSDSNKPVEAVGHGNVDLLTNNADIPDTEKDTQQMLKDLFDSPQRQALPPPTLSSDPNASSTTTPAVGGAQVFMPSQLLDFGLLDWGNGISAGPVQVPNPTTFPSTVPDIDPLGGMHTPAPGLQHSDVSEAANSIDVPSKASKVDWSKVFEDIDPLSDPASNYFASKSDEKGSC